MSEPILITRAARTVALGAAALLFAGCVEIDTGTGTGVRPAPQPTPISAPAPAPSRPQCNLGGPPSNFLDPNGNCYSCPNGFVRTIFNVDGPQACQREGAVFGNYSSARRL